MPNLKSLGIVQNRYADLIPQSSAAASKIREKFLHIFKARGFPDVEIYDDKISIGLRSRAYIFVRHKSGARMTIAIREYGSDLLLFWTLWFGATINWLLVGGTAVLFLLGAFNLGGRSVPVFGILCILAGVGLLGFAFFNGLFSKQLDFFAQEDMTALQQTVNYSLQQAIDETGIEFKMRELDSAPEVSTKRRRAI